MLDSLPERPLHRSEIEKLQNSDRIDLISPVYSDEPGTEGNDVAFAVVIAVNGSMKAVALGRDGWRVVRESDYQPNPGEGIPFDVADDMQRMQQAAIDGVEIF